MNFYRSITLTLLVSCSLVTSPFGLAMADLCVDADTAFINTTIYTAEEQQPTAKFVAIKDGRFIELGEQPPKFCQGTKIIDGQGLYIYPGFTDAHAHLKGVGYRESSLNLQGSKSLAAALAATKNYADKNPQLNWIVGRGWIEKLWPEKRFPTRQELDQLIPERPVVLTRADGHTILVNSKALSMAGIDAGTPAPAGGVIEKDQQGQPNGILIDNAMALVRRLIPAKTQVEDKQALAQALARNVRLGWTQTHNAGGSVADLDLLNQLKQRGQLKHRVYYALSQGDNSDQMLRQGPWLDDEHWITARGIKIYSDGALGSRGAALIEKYHDGKGSGLLLTDRKTIMPILKSALRKGVQIQTHAIGDLANRLVLDWYEQAFNSVPKSEWKIKQPRWRIEHAQNIQPSDQPRFKELGIIPSMQASHAIGDLHFAPARLGQQRLANAYPWKNMVDLGLKVAGGSDAPVEIGDPRIEFYAIVARKDLAGFSAKGWHPELSLNREQALKMLTLWPAYAAFQEQQLGSIKAGKLADLTIFDRNIMTVPEAEILKAQVKYTIVNGVIMHQAK